jgi:hypothetical protein
MLGMGGRMATGDSWSTRIGQPNRLHVNVPASPGVPAAVRQDRVVDPYLDIAAAEVEAHVAQSGWDQRPTLFALVRAEQFARDEPETAGRLGLGQAAGESLTPIEQEALPDGALDEALAQIAWPASVAGCALTQEIVIVPPAADREIETVEAAAAHPDRREARLVVAVLRDGSSAALLRLRPAAGADGADEDLLTGPDLAPNLVDALVATLHP